MARSDIDDHCKCCQNYRGTEEAVSTRGFPEQLVSDDGTHFTADEFWAFARSNGMKHIKSAPYHPATNGMAERFVQPLKQALRAALTKKTTISRKLINFLLAYSTTPHALNGEAPAVLLMGRNLRTRLDILKPNTRKRVEEKQRDHNCGQAATLTTSCT